MATFPGTGWVDGVGSGGIDGASIARCGGGGVLQTSLGMSNLSGESAV